MQKLYMIILLFLISALLMECTGEGSAEPAAKPEKAEKVTPVRTITLKPQSFSNYLEVTGTVHARNHIKIIVEEPGTLKEIKIDKGNRAAKNDTLAVLENKVLAAGFKKAKAVMQQAKLEFKSRNVLYEKKAISENEYLTAKYALDAAQAGYDLAKVRWEKLSIVAPISGFVNDRYYDIGAYTNAMTPIFEFIDNQFLKIRAGVAERFLGDINKGTAVQLTFDAYPELTIDAKVTFKSRSIDPRNRTFQIEIEIPNHNGKLSPEMIANVRILRQKFSDRLVIPLDALIESEKGWYVFVERNGIANQVFINQTAGYRDQVLVDGLSPNQNLIVVGHHNLSEGDSVAIFNN